MPVHGCLQYLEQQVGSLLQKSIADMLAVEPDNAADLRSSLQSRMNGTSAAAEAWARLQALQDGSDGPAAEATGGVISALHLLSLLSKLFAVVYPACMLAAPANTCLAQ